MDKDLNPSSSAELAVEDRIDHRQRTALDHDGLPCVEWRTDRRHLALCQAPADVFDNRVRNGSRSSILLQQTTNTGRPSNCVPQGKRVGDLEEHIAGKDPPMATVAHTSRPC